MAKFGVNVPPGIPVFSLDQVPDAAKKMASPDGEVGLGLPSLIQRLSIHLL